MVATAQVHTQYACIEHAVPRGAPASSPEARPAARSLHPQEVRSDALILLDRASKPKGKSKGGRLAADPRLAEAFGSMQRVLATPVRPEPKPSPGTEPE